MLLSSNIYAVETTKALRYNIFNNGRECILVFTAKSTLIIRSINITRLQIPMTPGFAVTNYKIERATFQTAVLDLHRNSNLGSKGSHKKFCSTYVQLLCLQTLDRVQYLQAITLEDIKSKPDPKLQKESLKLHDISD